MKKFSASDRSWADDISDITESAEWQTTVVSIVDPRKVTSTYDVNTGTKTITGDGVIYQGQARVKSLRSGLDRTNTNFSNPSTYSPMRVQIPHKYLRDVKVQRGNFVYIESAPHNPALEDLKMVITNSTEGASPATRTFYCEYDGDMRSEGGV